MFNKVRDEFISSADDINWAPEGWIRPFTSDCDMIIKDVSWLDFIFNFVRDEFFWRIDAKKDGPDSLVSPLHKWLNGFSISLFVNPHVCLIQINDFNSVPVSNEVIDELTSKTADSGFRIQKSNISPENSNSIPTTC